VFLNQNPLADVTNIKDVHTVVSNGNAFSFEELTGAVTAR
jgi:hypothetical protein